MLPPVRILSRVARHRGGPPWSARDPTRVSKPDTDKDDSRRFAYRAPAIGVARPVPASARRKAAMSSKSPLSISGNLALRRPVGAG